MYFFTSPRFGTPQQTAYEDTDENWRSILHPSGPFRPKDGPCIRGSYFRPGATNAGNAEVQAAFGAHFDVDAWLPGDEPLSFDQLVEHLKTFGYRFIAWTTHNHGVDKDKSKRDPRDEKRIVEPFVTDDPQWNAYRVYIPFACAVQDPEGEVDLPTRFTRLFEGMRLHFQLRWAPSFGEISRLGYYSGPNAACPEKYRYEIWGDQRFYPPSPEVVDTLVPREFVVTGAGSYDLPEEPVPEPDQTGWIPKDQAVHLAERYFVTAAQKSATEDPDSVREGQRHAKLFLWACKLWWDWWLDHQDVERILSAANACFPKPKSAKDIRDEVNMGFDRTRNPESTSRRVQRYKGHPDYPDGALKEPGCMRIPHTPSAEDWIELSAPLRNQRKDPFLQDQGKALAFCVRGDGAGCFVVLPSTLKQLKLPKGATADLILVNAAKAIGRLVVQEDLSQDFDALFAKVLKPTWEMNNVQEKLTQQSLVDEMRRAAQTVANDKHKEHLEFLKNAQSAQRKINSERSKKESYINWAFASVDPSSTRTTPYTKEELSLWAKQLGFHDAEQLRENSVLLVGSKARFFVAGEYRPETFPAVEDFNLSASKKLYPFEGFVHKTIDYDGEVRFVSAQKIKDDHAVRISAEGFTYDLTIPHSKFEGREKFRLATATRRQLQPKYDDRINQWLDTFSDPDSVKRWLAWFPDLTEPLPLLYLEGPRQAGKSLFGKALSRLWEHGEYSDMKDAITKFSTDWVKAPFFVADEAIPYELRRDSAQFRSMITNNTCYQESKGQSKVLVNGYRRFMLSANNGDQIPTNNDMTKDDMQAVTERILHLRLTKESGEFLLRAFPEGIQKAVVENNAFACHVLWLQQQRDPRAQGRWPVVFPRQKDFEDRTGNSTLRNEVLDILEDELSGNAVVFGDGGSPEKMIVPHVDKKKVYVAVLTKKLKNKISSRLRYKGNVTSPMVNRALASITSGTNNKHITGNVVASSKSWTFVDPYQLASAMASEEIVEDVEVFKSIFVGWLQREATDMEASPLTRDTAERMARAMGLTLQTNVHVN